MKNQREIKRLKKDCFNFKTVVTASQNVTQLLDLYNLTPAEFFRPFTDYKNEEIDIQTYKGFQKIKNLKIEFIDRQAYNVPIDQSFAYYQNKILQKNQPPLKYEDSELQIQGQKQAGIEFKPINTNTEWFEESSSNILQMCQYKPGINFFDQPVCLLYCAHVKDQNPEKTLEQMKRDNQGFIKEFYKYNEQDEQKLCKANFIFYDNSNQQQRAQADQIVQSLKQKYPEYLNRTIPLFSNIQQDQLQDDIFSKYQYKSYRTYYQLLNDQNQNKRYDQNILISNKDYSQIKTLIREMMKNFVFPFIQTQIENLKIQYAEAKKSSFTKTFSRFLRGSKDQKNNDELNQKEQIIRHLADIHFILGEYETSTFFYKALIDELNKKEDIAFANAVDAFALSSLLGEQNQMALNDKKQLLSYLESATQIYIKAGSHQQFSLKCLVYYIHALHILKQNDQKRAKFLWNCCFSVKDKHPYQLLHIIFLEQTALLYYNIGKSRHFCLHTLFSGYKYGQNGYKYHAINCFLQIIPFYDLVNWPQLKDLIYKFLVKYSQETGNFDQAIKFLKFNFNNTSQKDKDELRHEQIISDTIKLLTSLDSQNLNQDQKELLFFEGESIKIPFALQKTLDIKVQDEIVSYNSIQDHSVLSSINYDYLNQQNSKLKQANSYEQVQNQVWAEKGEILIKSENKGFLEIQRDRNILKCMGVQHIEQKQKIYDNVTANPNLNQKNYRMAYKGEMIQVSIILENNLKYPYEVKDLIIIYDFYDKNNNLVYTNSIVDELNQKKQQNVQNDSNENQKSQNINANKNNVNLLDMDLNQNEQDHKQQQLTNLLDADDMLNQEKQQQNQKSEQVWSTAPVQIQSQNIFFSPNQNVQFQSNIIPLQEGHIQIKGIQWKFMQFPNQQLFSFEQSYYNKITILPNDIVLKINIDNLDKNQNQLTLHYGEIHPIDLVFSNQGQETINEIHICLLDNLVFGETLRELKNLSLQLGHQEKVRIYLRAPQNSNFDAKILIKYKSQNLTRYSRLLIPVQVKDSLFIKNTTNKLFDCTAFNLQVDYSKLATEDVLQNKGKQQTKIQNQEHTNLLDDPNKECDQKSYQFNIESILILDPQWALKDIPYNSKNDFQNKKYVQLLVTNDKNHECQNNSFNSTNQEEKSDFDNQQQFDPEIEKDVSPTKKQQFTKAKNNSYIAIDEQFVKVINIDQSLNSPSIQRNNIIKQLNYEQNQSNENGIGDLLSQNNEEKFDGSINEQIQQTQQINQKLVKQFQGYEKGFLNPQIILAFVNQDHQEYLKTRTKEEIQQKLLQQCSFVIVYSLELNGQKSYGIYDIVKKSMNNQLYTSIKFGYNPLQMFPLKIKLNVQSHIKNDFSQNPILQIPLTLEITNMYYQDDLSFSIQAVDSNIALRNSQDTSFPVFNFEGNTNFSIQRLQLNEKKTVQLIAVFYQPGIYDISRFKYIFHLNKLTNLVADPTTLSPDTIQYEEKIYIPSDREHYIIKIE